MEFVIVSIGLSILFMIVAAVFFFALDRGRPTYSWSIPLLAGCLCGAASLQMSVRDGGGIVSLLVQGGQPVADVGAVHGGQAR